MNIPTILNVAIGLIFIYLTLSLLSSEIQEILATLLQWRAKHLQQSIELLIYGGNKVQSQLVKTEEKTDNRSAAEAPLIPATDSPISDEGSTTSVLPRYGTSEEATPISPVADDLIPPTDSQLSTHESIKNDVKKTQELVKTLYEHPLIKSLNQEAKSLAEKLKQDQEPKSLIGNIKRKLNPYRISGPSYIPSEAFATALVTIIKDSSSLNNKVEISLTEFQQAINEKFLKNILPEDLRITLIDLAEKSRIQVNQNTKESEKLRQEIANWFDESMQRASGVYKRNAKGVSFFIGFLVSLGINADTLNISNRLYKSQNLPQTLNKITDTIVENNNGCFPDTNRKDCLNNIDSALDDFSSLPVGWSGSNVKEQWRLPRNLRDELAWLGWLWTLVKFIIGLLLTTIAIGMGAPFWFELLGKFINVRNTGKRN
ncbi:MAG: hypothetical protein M3O33_13075 [Cyanobacteriota bacterium]|nr:hypothetical protein [Cyanobacteriota bacterium]